MSNEDTPATPYQAKLWKLQDVLIEHLEGVDCEEIIRLLFDALYHQLCHSDDLKLTEYVIQHTNKYLRDVLIQQYADEQVPELV